MSKQTGLFRGAIKAFRKRFQVGYEYQHYYNDLKAFEPPTGYGPGTDYLYPKGQDLEPVIPENERELYFYNKNYYEETVKRDPFGVDTMTTDLRDDPHHTGLPHWNDDPRIFKQLIERVDKGWIQVGWQMTDNKCISHCTEIYNMYDPDYGADESLDIQYQNVDNIVHFEEGLRDNGYAEREWGLKDPYDNDPKIFNQKQ